MDVLALDASHDGLLGSLIGAVALVLVAVIQSRRSTKGQVDEFREEMRERLGDLESRIDRLNDRMNGRP